MLLWLGATAANGQFLAREERPYNVLSLECKVTRVTPPDHDRDPGYKVNLSAGFYGNSKVRSFDVVHTTVSGKEYHRSDQYTDTNLTDYNGTIRWTGWRSDNRMMVGTLYSAAHGRWRYDEEVRHNDRIETTINTVCH
jgi:hypothetical protein